MTTLTIHADAKKKMLSPPQQRQRELAAVKHGVYATGTAVRLRHRRIRGRVRQLRKEHPALADKPQHLILRYAEVDALAAMIWIDLQENGPVNAEGEPRRLVNEYRLLLAELRSLAGTLGLLAAAESDPLASLLGGSR